MGEDVGVARPSSASLVAVRHSEATGLWPRRCCVLQFLSVVMVAMFFSEAGARPWTWEASPSEHKKWVEVGVRRADSRLELDLGLLFLSPARVSLSSVALARTALSFQRPVVND